MSFLLEFQENINDPWRREYVAYELIYEGFYKRCHTGQWTSKDEKDFEAAIRLEAGKVDMFINRKQREIESRIIFCERNLTRNMGDDASAKYALMDILADLNELSRFTRINFKALENLIELHDKLTNTSRQPLWVEVCRTRPLDKQRFDTVLVQVSSLLDICRKRLEVSSTAATPVNKQQQSARYWVHRDNVTEVKAMLLFNLPIYINNSAQEFQQSDQQTVSSVYFDNDHFTQYTSNLQWDDGVEVIKCQWYGDKESARWVTIERKRFVKTEYGGQCVHDQLKLDAHLVQAFISQDYTAEEYANELTMKNEYGEDYINACYTTAKSIQKAIQEKGLEPKLRVHCKRLLFQSPQDDTLSVTLDCNVTFARQHGVLRQGMDIYDSFKKLFPQQDLSLFPHSILECQMTGQELPIWLSKLLESKLVYEVPRFCKYLHGVAQFWGPQLSLLPWWLDELDQDIRKEAKTVTEVELLRSNNNGGGGQSKSLKPLIDGHYRMGYLESRLGKKQDGHQGVSVSCQEEQEGHLLTPDSVIAKQEDDDSLAPLTSTMSLPLLTSSTMGDMVSRPHLKYQASNYEKGAHGDSSFLHTYLDGREQSQAYMLQDADTVGQQDETRKAAIIEMEEDKKKEKQQEKKKKKKPRVHTLEPKQFFANERTFVHWLHFSAIIMSAALVLMNFGDRVSVVSGATFFGISLVLCLYAFFRYRYRAHQMSTQPHIRYDDLYGPFGLSVLLLGALILNFILRWEQPSSTTTYLGTSNQTGGEQTNQNQSSF